MTETTKNDPTESEKVDLKPSLWRRLRARRTTRWAIDLAIILVAILLISAFQSRHLLDSSEPLPSVELTSLDGTTLDLGDLDSRRTIIYFWATWCGACDIQAGAISALNKKAGDDLTIVSIVMSYRDEEQVRDFVESEGIDFPVYLGTSDMTDLFKISAFPTVYIVDSDLRPRHGLVGYTTRLGLQARLWI